MLTLKQFAAFTPKRQAEIRSAYIYIAQLLRDHRGKSKTILYIARQVAR